MLARCRPRRAAARRADQPPRRRRARPPHRSGGRLVVTGPNGAGKSTLLAVLAGAAKPSCGAVTRGSGVRVGWLGQGSTGPALDGHPSALGLLDRRDAHRPVGELSVGARRRLDLARVLAERTHVLLFDEPTNHLSAALVDELTEALEATAAAVVLATHDRQLLRDTAHWPRLELGA